MNFLESVNTCLKKYFVFEGRASRSEYWWFQLVVSPSYYISTFLENEISYFFLGITLVTFIPAISAGVRRLRHKSIRIFFINWLYSIHWRYYTIIFFNSRGNKWKK